MIFPLIFFLVFACVQIFTSAAFIAVNKLMGGDGTLSTDMQIVAMAASSLIIIIIFTATHWAHPTKDYMQTRPWGVLTWSVMAALGAVVPSMWIQEQMPELPNIVEQQMGDIMMHRGGYFVICLLGPVAEELVFRGAILRSLLHWKSEYQWSMISLSSFYFALIHFNPAQMPHAFVIGLLLGWMYQRTRSIAPCIAFHWANNTVAYILFRVYPDPSYRLVDIFSGQQRSVGAAVLFSLFILLPALYQLHLRMKSQKA